MRFLRIWFIGHSCISINWIIRKRSFVLTAFVCAKQKICQLNVCLISHTHLLILASNWFGGKILRHSKLFPNNIGLNERKFHCGFVFNHFRFIYKIITEWVELFSRDLWVINMVQRPRENEFSVKSECEIQSRTMCVWNNVIWTGLCTFVTSQVFFLTTASIIVAVVLVHIIAKSTQRIWKKKSFHLRWCGSVDHCKFTHTHTHCIGMTTH